MNRPIQAGIRLAAIAVFAVGMLAQTGTGARPSFEVASIKPNAPNETRIFMTETVDTLIATGADLKRLVGYAYALHDFEVLGATGWMISDRWQILAKMPENSVSPVREKYVPGVPETKALMLQSLLEDRFKLKVHREIRQLPVYELAVVKGGAKIKLSADQGAIMPRDPDAPHFVPGETLPRGAYSTTSGKFDASALSMADFTNFLVPHLDGPVIDNTGLQGLYDFSLRWAQSGFAFAAPDISADGQAGPSVFTALREQLGLQLTPTKGPVNVIVIDGAQKPISNP